MTVEQYVPPAAGIPGAPEWVATLGPAAWLAERIAGTDLVPAQYRGKPEAIVAAIVYGHELGLGPLQSLNSIDIVRGRASPRAELLRALVLAAGHSIEFEVLTDRKVVVVGRRKGFLPGQYGPPTRVEWDVAVAQRAGLGGEMYRKYPRQMLAARATSELCRLVFADVVRGLGDAEIEVVPGAGQDGAPEAPAGPLRRRKSAPALTAPAADEEAAAGALEPPGPVNGSADKPPGVPVSADESDPAPEPPPTVTAETPGADSAPERAATGDPAVDKATPEQWRRLMPLYREVFGDDDRDTRRQRIGEFLGREIATAAEVTVDEATSLIDTLDSIIAQPFADDDPPGVDPPAVLYEQVPGQTTIDEPAADGEQ